MGVPRVDDRLVAMLGDEQATGPVFSGGPGVLRYLVWLDLLVGFFDESGESDSMTIQLDPDTVIERGDLWSIAVNRNQNLLGKTMIVLDRPCTAVTDLDQTEWLTLHPEIQRVVSAIDSLFDPDQFNFAFLMNDDAQVHLHVLPRYASARTWNGQEFTDPNWGRPFGHEQRPLNPSELLALTSEIRSALPGSA